ncbi:hypothetical protein NQZ79_g6515 [Umbelopsis isabellina]|nr:hypothetical protein NQZ79_g6515 [Umbelopsis isabellina]
MSNSNGHATAISDETNSPEQSLEIPKVMNERTISDAVMEDDSEQTTEIPVQDPASAANPDLIAIANTDVLTVPWLELKATAKDRLLEITERDLISPESNADLQEECKELLSQIIEAFDTMEDFHHLIQCQLQVVLITSSITDFPSFDEEESPKDSRDWESNDAVVNSINGQPGHLTDATMNIVTHPIKEPLQFRHDHSSHEYQQELQHHMSSTAEASSSPSDRSTMQSGAISDIMQEDEEKPTTSATVVSDVVDVGNMNDDDKEKASHDHNTEKVVEDEVEGEGEGEEEIDASMDTTV